MFDPSAEPDLGFVFHRYDDPEHPGHPRLDVIIRPEPTYRHYDPERVHFTVASPAGYTERLAIGYPWSLGSRYRVCAGRVILEDRLDKQVEAFCFGGDLQIQTAGRQTICSLVSPAPIFPLFTTHDLPMWLTAEVEVLLAQQYARCCLAYPQAFQELLAAVDPLLLYAACLQALREDADRRTYREKGELERQGGRFVRAEVQRLQELGQWPAAPPSLDQLLTLKPGNH